MDPSGIVTATDDILGHPRWLLCTPDLGACPAGEQSTLVLADQRCGRAGPLCFDIHSRFRDFDLQRKEDFDVTPFLLATGDGLDDCASNLRHSSRVAQLCLV